MAQQHRQRQTMGIYRRGQEKTGENNQEQDRQRDTGGEIMGQLKRREKQWREGQRGDETIEIK